ncbi:AAA family ATPase [Ketobacter sp. MCCC 1A13808]|uniref:ExeA family protein n=1 Tax=Ketobacter sp. MCCC 1A13808 TaxID=2602738 RepID=UPI0012EC371F|nr:AAA family ATPase [Ketobacter sp. MCCC 1A13808]MVF10520.1 AAA family ATPase [Ketobacter sp. MCCC 1A13808]
MYERFFNLSETPFSIAPNPHYLYMSQQHNEALAHLVYGVGRDGGFVLLTGEVGTGKTTVCRCFLEQVPADTDVAFVLNPKVDVEELLATICDELSVPYIGDSITIKDYVDCINTFLLRQHGEGRHTVLIIDEAQNLSPAVLEQIRLLTNLETHEKKLLQIILLGQPELQDMFRRTELRQLSQRVTARFHLSALKEEEVAPYIYHRLSVAGSIDPRAIFPPPVIKRIYQISKGIPRIINLICDRAMLGAYAKESRVIEPAIINNAAKEVLGYEVYSPVPKLKYKWLPAVAGGMAGGLLMFAMSFWFISDGNHQLDKVSPANSGITEQGQDLIESPEQNKTGLAFEQEEAPPPTAILSPVEQALRDKAASGEEKPVDALEMADVYAKTSHWEEADAYTDLFSSWNRNYDPKKDGSACSFAEASGLSCLSKLGSLGSIKHYGLPVILRLYNDKGDERYVVMRHLGDQYADIYVAGEVRRVSLAQLDAFWRGHFSLLWRKPEDYFGPMSPGTIAPLSKWLSYQLDLWENKPEPMMGRSSYDDALVERVKSFQRHVGESDDGVVGSGTLIQLTRRVDDSVPQLLDSQRGS